MERVRNSAFFKGDGTAYPIEPKEGTQYYLCGESEKEETH